MLVQQVGLEDFGKDPGWVIVLKAVLVFVVLVLLTLFNIWAERRVVARMQHRVVPNVHGPFGLLQSLADGVKLALGGHHSEGRRQAGLHPGADHRGHSRICGPSR